MPACIQPSAAVAVLHLLACLSEPALASLIAYYSLVKVVLAEIGPVGVAEYSSL